MKNKAKEKKEEGRKRKRKFQSHRVNKSFDRCGLHVYSSTKNSHRFRNELG